jgi:hypothetical protein
MKKFLLGIIVALPLFSFSQNLTNQEEPHLKNLKQLTFGGDNAEAYFSFDRKKITFQTRQIVPGHCQW